MAGTTSLTKMGSARVAEGHPAHYARRVDPADKPQLNVLLLAAGVVAAPSLFVSHTGSFSAPTPQTVSSASDVTTMGAASVPAMINLLLPALTLRLAS